jgi:23S rRNA (uracil1939-C5)-methyltransferase
MKPKDTVRALAQPQATRVAVAQPLQLEAEGCVAQDREGNRFLVSAAVPGDTLEIAPLRSATQPRPAAVVRVLQAAAARVQAPCALLEECGGCTFQAMAYPAQVAAKDAALRALLAPLAPQSWEPTRALTRPFAARTRLLLQAEEAAGRSRGLRLGFYRRGSAKLVSIRSCPTQHPLTLAPVEAIRRILEKSTIYATSTRQEEGGWLHGLSVRADPPSGQCEVTLIVRSERAPVKPHFVKHIAALEGVAGVHLAINPQRTSHLFGEQFVHLAGHKRTIFHVGGEALHLSPGTFLQTNHEGAEQLAEVVRGFLPAQVKLLADLYGGAGVMSRLTQGRWSQALVAESNPQALDDLRAWLRVSERRDLRVFPGLVESTIQKVMALSPDVVLLDPPRSGCHERVLQALGHHKPPVVVYVACGAASLARDGAALLAQGYQLERVASVDMFPHTPHLEAVARFTLR